PRSAPFPYTTLFRSVVRVQDIRANLVAPAGVHVLALQLLELGFLLLALHFEQPRLQDLQGALAVLRLAALVLALDDDAGWNVRQDRKSTRLNSSHVK